MGCLRTAAGVAFSAVILTGVAAVPVAAEPQSAAPARTYKSGTYYFIPKAGATGWLDGCDYAVKIQIKGNRIRKTGTVAYGACHAEWTNGWVRIVKGKVQGGCVPYHPELQYKCAKAVFPPATGSHAMVRVSRAKAMSAYPPDTNRWDDFLKHADLPWD